MWTHEYACRRTGKTLFTYCWKTARQRRRCRTCTSFYIFRWVLLQLAVISRVKLALRVCTTDPGVLPGTSSNHEGAVVLVLWVWRGGILIALVLEPAHWHKGNSSIRFGSSVNRSAILLASKFFHLDFAWVELQGLTVPQNMVAFEDAARQSNPPPTSRFENKSACARLTPTSVVAVLPALPFGHFHNNP